VRRSGVLFVLAIGATSLIVGCTGGNSPNASNASASRTASLAPASGSADEGPVSATQVPNELPPQGVDVNNVAILRPAPIGVMPAVSREQAIALAEQNDNGPGSQVTLATLALFSDAGADSDLPSSAGDPNNPTPHSVSRLLCWVITFTWSQSVNVAQGGGIAYASHDHVVIEATTGAFVRGFMTA
jgi:hypothetical protein